jgi:hypothetical protein
MKALPGAVAALALSLAACASAPPTTPSTLVKTPAPAPSFSATEEDAILASVDAFLLAVGNRDAAALAALTVPDGTTFFQRSTASGPGAVGHRANAQMFAPAADADPFIERYWSPTVMVRGGIAQVWAPYELRDNGKVVHCGIDAFDMVKLDGKWIVGNAMTSMEPDACDEIKPPSLSAMRPRDGWKETPNN